MPFKLFLTLLSISVLLIACPRSIQQRFLTAEEMGIRPTDFSEVPTGRSSRSPCRTIANYQVDTTHLDHYPTKFIRVNFHWMNSTDGQNNIPEEEALAYTKDILHAMNYALDNNKKMWMPHNNDTPIHPTNLRYVLTGRADDPTDTGVYYHYDDELYFYVHYRRKDSNLYTRDVLDKYGVQLDTVLNFFMMPHQPDSVASPTYKAGRVGVALGNATKVAALWKQDFERDRKEVFWRYRGYINHEVGHLLGLSHAWTRSDGCEDTPVHPNRCWSPSESAYCDTMTSNNVMDYCALQLAWTPCQLGKVHRRFAELKSTSRKFLEPRWCTRDTAYDIVITDSVDWSCDRDLYGNLTIADGGELRMYCRTSVPAGGTITIESGGKLILDGAQLHQACDERWRGIVVQEVNEQEGELVLLNNARIEDVELNLD